MDNPARVPAAVQILLIDDEADFCELFAFEFRKEGFEVLIAGSAKEAFHFILNENPACILLDIRLSGESGLSILRKIRSFRAEDGVLEERVRRLPVLVLTSAGHQMSELFLGEGANDYIVKPYDLKQLKQKILHFASK